MHDIYKLLDALASGMKVLNQHMGQEIDFRAVHSVSPLLWEISYTLTGVMCPMFAPI
jgi:hypothetical protein